ncbi:LANO_0H21396g1_1 [Lachancea nothofagi CBS 11611]|uniref:LANO_0H21396g1_1 n=1 Tax=Lachancea nothofagi CBS 11611 TaxID=1266666 RepID=A0A1G4KND0_9SACH|nr:LANO_0H21396g1_1 [Lachancea nothofagi CBS 11611]
MSEASVQSLLDMGITREVALEALAKTNGDIEASVNYIFSGELPQQEPQMDTVELPSEEIKEDIQTDFPIQETTEYIEDANAPSVSSPSGDEPGSWTAPVPSYDECLAQQIRQCSDDPLVVQVGTNNSLMENYFALFCLAVGFGFPHVFLKPDFKDLVYGKDWYQGQALKPKFRIKYGVDNTVAIVPQEELAGQDNLALQPELLWQLQKLLAVQNTTGCLRKYVTAKFFARVLEPLVVEKLNNCEHLHDVLPTFIKSIATDVELCPGMSSIKSLFISTAYYKPPSEPEPVETLVSLLHFMPEEYDSNLYKMFNALLYPEDDSDCETDDTQNSLGNLAPMITIVFDEMDESTESLNLPNGVEVPLEFYPQLYTEKAKKLLINDVLTNARNAELEARKALRSLNELKSFQGKHIHSFLNSTLDFIMKDTGSISNQPEVASLVNSLEQVKEQLGERKTDSLAEYKAITHKLNNEWNLSHPELGIVKSAHDLGIVDVPYLLTSAVLSPANYFLRQRNGQWYHVTGKINNNDMEISKVTPLDVVYTIRSHTRVASETPLMFTYFKQCAIESDATVQEALDSNVGARNFALRDQDTIEAMKPTSSEDLIEL